MRSRYLPLDECHFQQEDGHYRRGDHPPNNNSFKITGVGNGRLDAVSNAIKHYFDISYELAFYEEHSLTKGSSSRAVAYVGVICNKKRYWGCRDRRRYHQASIEALVVAVNKIREIAESQAAKMNGCWRSQIISMQI